MRGSRLRATRGCVAHVSSRVFAPVLARVLVVVILGIGVGGPITTRAGAATATPADAGWQLPVSGPVVRSFSAPASAYGPGHRGIDLVAAPGTPVITAGRGTVVFAGDVAGAQHVVVLHRGGVRTSYSFLSDVQVAVGDVIDGGSLVGHAGGADPDGVHAGVVHFGVRVGAEYVDPLTLFRSGSLSSRVRLVPVGGAAPSGGSWARARSDEAVTMLDGLGSPPSGGDDASCGPSIPLVDAVVQTLCRGVVAAIDWAAARTRQAVRVGRVLLAGSGRVGAALAERLGPDLDRVLDALGSGAGAVVAGLGEQPFVRVLTDLAEIGERFLEWTDRECAKDAPAADGTGGSGHLVMAVGGIDSASRPGGPSFGLRVDALGYHPDEVHWFSYAADGGAYDASDTYGDLEQAARRLAAQLRAIDAAEPGREVDLIAHSQGGVVVERFLRAEYDASDPTFPPLGTVVTLSSPHQGAPLATAARDLRADRRTRRVLEVLDRVRPGPPSDATSVRQLAEGSPFLDRLQRAPLPEQIELTTVGGTDDLVVPANRIHLPGATEVVVGVKGLGDHGAIVRDGRALQVVRSALEQRPPPCTSLLEGLRGAIEPVLISRVEGDLGEYLTTYLEVGP